MFYTETCAKVESSTSIDTDSTECVADVWQIHLQILLSCIIICKSIYNMCVDPDINKVCTHTYPCIHIW